ncbi:MAG: GIY-YIG nuclease family protein [Saprospiraceae bacterium]|nr:GIY-YIG nuclease family protein [Bacteroidia bacterium]NNK89141.1 GIY-YIG nuclease family protein [Saprospiraceae bacterium]
MKYWVYILISKSSGRFYIGQTSNLDSRLNYHNSNRVKSTKNRGPWSFLFTIQVDSLKAALTLERKLKNLKSRKRLINWVRNHIDDRGSVGPEFYQIFDLD